MVEWIIYICVFFLFTCRYVNSADARIVDMTIVSEAERGIVFKMAFSLFLLLLAKIIFTT
jgi:hypothetical protein